MKLKIHWGWGIAIFYSLFVLSLLGFLFFTTFNRVDLVEEDYYEKEINYQQQIDKETRTANLAGKLTMQPSGSVFILTFPGELDPSTIGGSIHFYRPSSKRLDQKFKIEADSSGMQVLPVNTLRKGLWFVKVDWSAGDSAYYNEEKFIF